jgi:hypothetical protein
MHVYVAKLESHHITFTLLVPEIMHIYAAKLETHHITFTLLVPEIMHFMKQS